MYSWNLKDRGEECNGAWIWGAQRGQRWLREGGDLQDKFSKATGQILQVFMSDLGDFASAAARASARPATLSMRMRPGGIEDEGSLTFSYTRSQIPRAHVILYMAFPSTI